MIRTILLAVILLSSCGSEEDVCRGEMVSGLCLYKGGFNISSAAVSDTVEIVQAEVNKEYPDLDLPYMFEAYGVFAKYVPKYKMAEGVRGLYRYFDHRIFVRAIESPSAIPANLVCREHYYVLGHEMLHFIVREYLGESSEDSNDHSHPMFLASVSEDNPAQYVKTVEGQIYLNVAWLCSDLVGPLGE